MRALFSVCFLLRFIYTTCSPRAPDLKSSLGSMSGG